MSYMFYHCTAFNQDVSGWDIRQVTNMTNMFNGVTLSTANYNALLIHWEAQGPQHGVNFHGGNSKYSIAAAAARASLINNYGWTIFDGGLL